MFLPWIILDWANEGYGAINSGGGSSCISVNKYCWIRQMKGAMRFIVGGRCSFCISLNKLVPQFTV